MHNIDVMHQESNFCQALINTCMDFSDKTKYKDNAHMDLAMICGRPTQVIRENRGKPKAYYCLKPKKRKEVMKWMKDLKFPNGYAVDFRRSMNLKTMNMKGLKSHDFQVIIERLVSVIFRGYVSDVVWKTLAKVSYFYRQLCAKEIRRDVMEQLENEAPVLLCKLEKIFPLGFFNPMQHLFIHLPYEAKVGGPVYYMGMFHIERTLKKLRAMVDNNARVEGCIAEQFKLKEVEHFTSCYFAEEHNVFARNKRYHDDEREMPPCSDLSIFQTNGKAVGPPKAYHLTMEEHKSALLYVFTNMPKVEKYLVQDFISLNYSYVN
jgi:hypothetical protein